MKFEDFKHSLHENPVELSIKDHSSQEVRIDNEALFQLPFISMVILMLAKGASKPMVSHIGSLVGECIEQSMPAFKKSKQQIGWSAQLRLRTVNALSFLELSNLIVVGNRKGRITITEQGKKVLNSALKEESDLSYNLNVISRKYRNICKAQKLEQVLN